jgi:magnesium/cobalt transport protein CorA
MKITSYLYDADGTDKEIDLDEIDIKTLDEKKLLWINVLERDPGAVETVVKKLGLKRAPIHSVTSKSTRPKIENFEDFFRFSVQAVTSVDDKKKSSLERLPIDYVVGPNFVVTVHDGEVDDFVEFRKREKGETQFGELNAESFVATLLDFHIVSYFRAIDDIERSVDKLDAAVLKRDIETEDFLAEMVRLRSDVSKLRRWLMPHRDVIYSFLRADFQKITDLDSLEQFKLLSAHFENAVDAVDSARESVISVFDLYATKSSQLTNIFIQRLTFLTLITGSLSVIAGILGMNYKEDFFDSSNGFWYTLVGMALIAIGLTVYARFRRWI